MSLVGWGTKNECRVRFELFALPVDNAGSDEGALGGATLRIIDPAFAFAFN
jgi:hypothetical protein